jgi:hypothetical protein
VRGNLARSLHPASGWYRWRIENIEKIDGRSDFSVSLALYGLDGVNLRFSTITCTHHLPNFKCRSLSCVLIFDHTENGNALTDEAAKMDMYDIKRG